MFRSNELKEVGSKASTQLCPSAGDTHKNAWLLTAISSSTVLGISFWWNLPMIIYLWRQIGDIFKCNQCLCSSLVWLVGYTSPLVFCVLCGAMLYVVRSISAVHASIYVSCISNNNLLGIATLSSHTLQFASSFILHFSIFDFQSLSPTLCHHFSVNYNQLKLASYRLIVHSYVFSVQL